VRTATTIDKQIGARLRDARLQAVFTQDELAHHLEVDRSTVAKWETGQRSMTVESLIRAAAILGIPPQQLLVESTSDRPAARPINEVIIAQQATETITRMLEQRPDAIPIVIASLQRWSQSGITTESAALSESTRGSYAAQTIIQQLHDIDITLMTPLRALQLLNEWQQLASNAPTVIEATE
jgi:transcriptional regulator with XRE-family HTH domain